MDHASADTEDLARFVDAGRRHGASLRWLRDRVAERRQLVSLDLGWSPPPPSAALALDELIDRASGDTTFVEVINEALLAFDPDPSTPAASVLVAVIDANLADAGGRVAVDIAPVGQTYRDVVHAIDKGDDLGMSNGELNRVNDLAAALEPDEADLVIGSLSDEQLRVLFHNVHSSGFWSNDWDDRERSEFYALFGPMSTEVKTRTGRFSPYLEALAAAEAATVGDDRAARALTDLHTAADFTAELDFDERIALLAQAANYPDVRSIANLERMAGREWFQRLDLADSQRSAKMIAFLSQHQTGDRVVIANTLDLFLDPHAPYGLDWDQDERAYGSAGGERFHLNRIYLDAGNEPVDRSVPTDAVLNETERMVTHTVAHEVNHLVNGDRVTTTYEYFMGEYRALYVGQLARTGTAPTRAGVEDRVETLLTASRGAYARIADAVDDPIEGPLIAAFVSDIIGRPVAAGDLVTEIRAGVTDPSELAPIPVSVDGGPNVLDNHRRPEAR
ncbi:MAG: hypothetical protein ACR2QO_22075 [Acidimicrobiales bacterium]